MVFSVILLVGLILAPLLAHLRGWGPAGLFCAAAIVYAVLGASSIAQVHVFLSQIQKPESALHDTYYVVSHGNFLILNGVVMAVLGAITWVQTRFGLMTYPRLTKALFWVFHIAMMGGSVVQTVLAFLLPVPRRYIDYAEFIQTVTLINTSSGLLSGAALLGLLGLLAWSVIAKGRER